MKTKCSVLLFLLLLASPIVVQAQTYTNADGGIFFYGTNAGTIVIYAFEGTGDVTIPTNIYGVTVTSIYGWAFQDSNPTSVTIPGSVTSIGEYAFDQCTSLTNLTLEDGITNIGGLAFLYCTNLTSVTIPGSVTSFGEQAFLQCTGLTNVTLGSGITNIPYLAFSECTSLTSLLIPDSVTSIGSGAFFICTSLPAVSIPASVTSIGDVAFGLCSNLTAITVAAQNAFYSSRNGVLFDHNQTTLVQYPPGLTGNYIIPCGVTNIGDAFMDCSNLSSLTIPGSVTNLQQYALSYCGSLTNVYFSGNAPSGDSTVFYSYPSAITETVYYLPGTTGWGATFGGAPTALWVLPYPLILNTASSLGVQSNGFGFTVSWATNVTVVVQACTNLADPAWIPLQTNTLTNGSFYFSDPQWTNYRDRYYRISLP
jgi:hypothetical protein